MSKLLRKIGGTLLVLALLLSMSVTAFAYTRINVDAETSLTLECKYGEGKTAISGADFRIYKIAEISDANYYTLTEEFEKYSVKLEDLDSAGWLDLAATLAAYAARDELIPTAEGTTDDSGKVKFAELTVGLYLVVGDSVTIGSHIYSFTPFIVSLPSLSADDEWVYDTTAEVKIESAYVIDEDSTVRRSVVKVWADDDGESRPNSVTVQLLRNGDVYSEVVLNEENGWKYTWEDLPNGYNWQLAEKDVPEGYTVSVSQNGTVFTVTNTHTVDEPDEPEEPGITDNPDDPTTPTTPDNPSEPTTPDTPSEPKLPQTGQLWWPVPLLAGCGLVLYAVGWGLVFLKRKKDA